MKSSKILNEERNEYITDPQIPVYFKQVIKY